MPKGQAKITELYPSRMKRLRLKKLLVPFVVLLVLMMTGLSLYMFREDLDLDRVRRYFRYLGSRDSDSYGVYVFDAHSANAYAAVGDGLAMASVAGLDLYGPSGEEVASVSASVRVPAVSAGEDLALLWDVGGTTLAAARPDRGQVLDLSLDRPLLDADVSQSGEICYASAADGYRTVITVLDADQQERYRWLSSSRYMPLCAIAEGGALLAAVSVGGLEGTFESRLQLFHTDSEQAGVDISLGGQWIYDLDFLDRDVVCAVGESSVQFFDTTGAKLGEYAYAGEHLKDYCLQGDGHAILCLSPFQSGSRCELVSVLPDGTASARTTLDDGIQSLSAAGSYVAALSAGCLRVFKGELTPYYETAEVAGETHCQVRRDGTTLLIGGSSARLYLP
ncbi:MAG: hypothetical protein HFF08_00630 [Oscillospiraceae bacterium]|nr:hypothetical protein [Oscillospiraceae bacterium]